MLCDIFFYLLCNIDACSIKACRKRLTWHWMHYRLEPKWSPWLPFTRALNILFLQRVSLWPVRGDFKDFMGSVNLSCVPSSGKLRVNQVTLRQRASDIKSLIVIGEILKDYSTVGSCDRMENILSNILSQITVSHADVTNSPSAYTINLIKMCMYGSSGNAD